MRCPICFKSATAAFKPFCSQRCADADLSKWMRGEYAVPAVESDDEPEDAPAEEEE